MNAPLLNAMHRGAVEMRTHRHGADAFATPWHVCVHGLGIDTGVASVSLAPLLQLSALLVERSQAEPLAVVTHELLQLLSCHAAPDAAPARAACLQRIASLLGGIADLETRALAQAATLHVLACVGIGEDGMLCALMRGTLVELLGAPPTYQTLCAAAQLFNAAQRIALSRSEREALGELLDRAVQQTWQLAQPFHAKRIKAVLLAVQARGALGQPSPRWLDDLGRLLGECAAIHGPLPQEDAIHSGLDFLAFPLALALEAATQCAPGSRLAADSGAVDTALYLLDQLSPASKVSQLAFLVAPLLAMDAVPSAHLRERACSAWRDYLDNSAAGDADAYLRSVYAIYAASRLGCAELLPREVFTRLEAALLVRGRPAAGYFSLPMVAAYVLYSSCVAPEVQRALPDAGALFEIMVSLLPKQAMPTGEVRKLSHVLLYLGLTRHAGHSERSSSNIAFEVLV